MKVFITIIIIISLGLACTKPVQECFVPRSVAVKTNFKVLDTILHQDGNGFVTPEIVTRDTGLNKPSFTSIDQDSNIVFIGERGVSNLSFFLNADTSQMSYVFKPNADSSYTDTISISYSQYQHFISNDCGYTYNYKLSQVQSTHNKVNYPEIKNADVNATSQISNLIIYIKKNR